ncbi:MAG: hypothetical protein WA125_05605 [Desulfosporosinus sp.]
MWLGRGRNADEKNLLYYFAVEEFCVIKKLEKIHLGLSIENLCV